MSPPLDEIEVRVLGSLIEKEHFTPDNYPLSLNSLTAACNQSSNRDPVMSLDEPTVSAALDRLRGRSLVRAIIHSGGRVTKYQHLMDENMGLVRRQLAVLSVLMLRGAQTPGEIRTRSQRVYDFRDFEELESTIDGLIDRQPPLVTRLPRRPGQKEARFAHMLAGEPVVPDEPTIEVRPPSATGSDRISSLEERVDALSREVADLRSALDGFRKQFE